MRKERGRQEQKHERIILKVNELKTSSREAGRRRNGREKQSFQNAGNHNWCSPEGIELQ